MKKILSLFVFVMLTNILTAEISKTVNVTTAGTLSTLTSAYLSTVTNLTVTGNIDARDVKCMRDQMTALTVLDISAVSIVAYTGIGGTYGTASTSYPVNTMPSYSFFNYSGNTTLKTISLPITITTIGSNAFKSCIGLIGNLIIPNSVNSIGDNAFLNCRGLTGDLIMPNSLTSIGSGAFAGCGLIGSLKLGNSVTSIGSGAFESCSGLTGNLTIPNSVTSIGDHAFSGCSRLTGTLILPNSITTISDWAFRDCVGLSGVDIPLSVNSIGTGAFCGCNKLSFINISKNTNYIGESAFFGCSSLSKISMPRSIPATIFVETFEGVNKQTCTLEIPIGASLAYQAATTYWSLFTLLSETAMAESYGITIQIGTNGVVKENNVSLTNGAILSINSGASKTVTFTPNTGYEVATLSYAGVDVKSQIVNNQYTIPAVSSNNTLSVTFQKSHYLLALKNASNGTMDLVCEYGTTPSIKFTPTLGWKINTVTYDGVDVTNFLVNDIYTVPAITDNTLLCVSFESLLSSTPELVNNKVKVYSSQSEIFVEGTSDGETVTIFTIDGKQIHNINSKGEIINIPVDRDFIYLVKTRLKTFKVIL